MQKDNFTDFDLEMRKIFLNAEEEVPSQLWESLSSELDIRDRRKTVALWWRRAAAGVAVAAAALSGIFIISDHSSDMGQDHLPAVTAEAGTVPVLESAEESLDILDITEQIASSSRLFLADVPPMTQPAFKAEEKPSEIIPVEEFIHETAGESEKEPAVQPRASEKESVEEEWKDPFGQLEPETARNRHGISISLFGDVMSNDATSNSSTAHRSPVIGSSSKTGIIEKSISTYGIPMSLGLGVKVDFSDKWSVGTGLNWSMLSRTFTGIYTKVDQSGAIVKSVNSDITNNLHYIGIPLNVYYNVLSNRNLKFYAWGGGTAEKGVINRFRVHSSPDDIFYSENVKGFQWSAGLGLGLEFSLNDYLNLYVDPSARYYFDCNQPNSVRTQKPFMLDFEMGLRFNL